MCVIIYDKFLNVKSRQDLQRQRGEVTESPVLLTERWGGPGTAPGSALWTAPVASSGEMVLWMKLIHRIVTPHLRDRQGRFPTVFAARVIQYFIQLQFNGFLK